MNLKNNHIVGRPSMMKPLIFLFAGVLILEYCIMLVFDLFPALPEWLLGAIDCVVLTIYFVPVLYFFIIRPREKYLLEQKKAEELLEKSEETYRMIFESSPIATAFWDIEARIIFWNKAAEKIFGWSKEEVIGKKFTEFFIPESDRKYVEENIGLLVQNISRETTVNENLRKDGTAILCEWSNTIIQDKDGNASTVVSMAKDVTEQKRNEEALMESERKFRNLFEHSLVGKSMTEINGTLHVNEAFCNIMGYTEGELKTMTWMDITHPEDVQKSKELAQALLEGTSDRVRFEKRHIHKTGKIIHTDVYVYLQRDKEGKPLFFITNVVDITEQKRSEEALLESGNMLAEAERIGHSGSWAYEVASNSSWWSANMFRIFDVDPTTSDPHKLKDFIELAAHPDDRSRVHDVFSQSLEGKCKYDLEFRIIWRNGSVRLIHSIFQVVKDTNRKAIRMIGRVEDITERRKAEEALRKNEAMLNTLLQTIPDLIWLKDSNGVYLTCNALFERLYGATREEIVGKTDYDFVEKELADFFRENDRAATLAGKPTRNHEWLTFADDGHRALMETTKTTMFDSEGELIGVLGIAHDITGFKRAEEALKQSEEKFNKAFHNSPDAITITRASDGMLIDVNDSLERLSGYTRDEVVGNNSVDMKLWITRQDRDRYVFALKESGRVTDFETNFRTKSGEVRSFLLSGEIFEMNEEKYILGVIRDVTERKRTELELIESKELAERSERELAQKNKQLTERNKFIQTILDHLPIGLSLNNIDEGVATYMNKKFQEIYGWGPEEITSISTFFERVYPDAGYREEMINRIMADILSGDPERMHWENVFITRKDGAKRVINAVNIPLPEQNTMVSTVTDITDLHKTQHDLLQAKVKAEESDKLKSAFLANMSHEIRTPLNSIIGFSELLTDSDFDRVQRTDFARMINENGNSLLAILSDIMDLSKIEAGQVQVKKSTLFVSKLIAEIQKEFTYKAAEKGIELRLDSLNPPTLIIDSDETKIRQIIVNLISNALKFTHSGYIELGVRVFDHQVCFQVKDTGIGIPAEFRQQIFERFRQIESSYNRKYGGNGLGLAISKSLVELLGGKIWMESEINRGTTFYFTVPN